MGSIEVKAFNVLGNFIEVKKVKNLVNTQLIYGCYNPREKLIQIDAGLKGMQRDHTLIHELIHATLHRIGFENTGLLPELEELIADNIARSITENAKIKWIKHK